MTAREGDIGRMMVIRLTPLAPDTARAARTRSRCRRMLARQRQHHARAAAVKEHAAGSIALALVAAGCLLYAVALITTTLQIEGIVR